jgi:hypothetical protein
MKTKISLLFAIVAMLMIVSGCSSVSLTASWIDPEVKNIEGKSIAIFCLTPRLDIRDRIETEMSDAFQAKGVNAMRSLDFITPGKMEKEVIALILEKNNITGVILVSLLDAQKETYYVPGSTSYYPAAYGRPYYGYYGSTYAAVYDPGYYQTTTSYFIECNAYRLSDEKLAYSAQSKTVDPSSIEKFAYDYSRAIVDDLVSKGVMGAPAEK